MIPQDDEPVGATTPAAPSLDIQRPSSGLIDTETIDSTDRAGNGLPLAPTGAAEHAPAKPSTPSQSVAAQAEDISTKILEFLSTATPETFGAIGAGLALLTYLILGNFGLLLIGAFAGITLFAIVERSNPEVSRAIRGERGYDVLQRLLGQEEKALRSKTISDLDNSDDMIVRSFDDFLPDTRAALNEFVDAVVRDYVNWWYSPIVPYDKSFPLTCRNVLTSYMITMSNQLRRKRPADAFVDFLTHSCSIIIVFFSEMANAHNELPADSHAASVDAIYNYLSSHTDSPLANLLSQKQQASKFKMVAEDLLGFLDKQSHDCDPVRVFLREIMSTIILEGTLQTCSKAEWINGWIVYLLESGETDLSQAIDEAIEQKAFSDVDGNVGNIGLSKGNRNSYDMDRARRKEQGHKKKLSKADEEMEKAMEEVKRLNKMIAEANKASTPNAPTMISEEASGLLSNALENNAKELDLNVSPRQSVEASQARIRSSPTASPPNGDGKSYSPVAPKSAVDLPSQRLSSLELDKPSPPTRSFTTFDQFVPPAKDEPDDDDDRNRPTPLTLHNAAITIHDDIGNDRGQLRAKPNWEYLVQIEPASNQHSGWMVMKTYTQFEGLHESLRRIANISGSAAFLEAHAMFPSWKIHTRSSLRGEIERYLRMACVEKPLAESEALKRFLEKSQATRMTANRGFSFESMGKGMLGAIQNAPKGALDGSKVVVGGVTGVFNNIGLGPRRTTNTSLQEPPAPHRQRSVSPRPQSLSSLPRLDSTPASMNGTAMRSRDSLDSQPASVISTQPGKVAPMDRRPSYQIDMDSEGLQPMTSDRWDHRSVSTTSSRAHSRASSLAAKRSPMRSPSETSLSKLKLPPPPTEMTDDYESPTTTRHSIDVSRLLSPKTGLGSLSNTPPTRSPVSGHQEKPQQPNGLRKRLPKHHPPLSEAETRVAVELLFAVINELYTLSSAWNIRRTLLAAAKSFMLRPGNPSLNSIQALIQHSLIDVNTTDDGIAAHIRKLRGNTLPTEEERAGWPAELTADEKEELRVKARKLFIQSSVPAALMGIMGQSATSEALGRVFDCLQIEEVARGLFFGLMLQAARVVTH